VTIIGNYVKCNPSPYIRFFIAPSVSYNACARFSSEYQRFLATGATVYRFVVVLNCLMRGAASLDAALFVLFLM
ncbi:hypothetical protein, partial [Escherichia coli]|uniref:hypothetical protein n=1 Tax=Escherichia coli TaxID=562 RepID=UPI003EE02A66